jgi:hypothetical protein
MEASRRQIEEGYRHLLYGMCGSCCCLKTTSVSSPHCIYKTPKECKDIIGSKTAVSEEEEDGEGGGNRQLCE